MVPYLSHNILLNVKQYSLSMTAKIWKSHVFCGIVFFLLSMNTYVHLLSHLTPLEIRSSSNVPANQHSVLSQSPRFYLLCQATILFIFSPDPPPPPLFLHPPPLYTKLYFQNEIYNMWTIIQILKIACIWRVVAKSKYLCLLKVCKGILDLKPFLSIGRLFSALSIIFSEIFIEPLF